MNNNKKNALQPQTNQNQTDNQAQINIHQILIKYSTQTSQLNHGW